MTRTIIGLVAAVALLAECTVGANIVVPVSEDAAIFSRSDNPNLAATNFGTFYNLYAGSFEPSASSYSRSLLKFNLPLLSQGQTVQSATFRLVAGQEFPQLGTYDFFQVDDNWTEGTVTWLSAPQPVPAQSPIATFVNSLGIAPTPATSLVFNITAAVQAEYNSDQVLSILWKDRNETGTCCDRLVARSQELAVISDNIPRLDLVIVPEPSCWVLLGGIILIPASLRMQRSPETKPLFRRWACSIFCWSSIVQSRGKR